MILIAYPSHNYSHHHRLRSYKELLPLVPTLLNDFYRVYNSTCSPPLRHAIIEVCLTIPSRLSLLLPQLPLLLKIIIPALNSSVGVLTNLALRTLEFWVDNLHPDFLYPIFATQDDDGTGHCNLMVALTRHLQPAPYPYGLLCMRLLGKLGGINRLFFQGMIGFNNQKQTTRSRKQKVAGSDNLSMHCEWWQGGAVAESSSEMSFLLPFPLDCAVDVLRCVAGAPCINVSKHCERESVHFSCQMFSELLSVDPRKFNLNRYIIEVMEETKTSQSKSAFTVLRAALASLLDIDNGEGEILLCTENGFVFPDNKEGTFVEGKNNHDFKLICDGLYAASIHEDLNDEAMLMLKGLGSHIFYVILSHRANVTRVNCDGWPIDPYHGNGDAQSEEKKSFGCFRLSGPDIDPFVFNEALADALTDSDVNTSHVTALAVMRHVIELFHSLRVITTDETDTGWGDIFFENLLSKLCRFCFSQSWDNRAGVMSGLLNLIVEMGLPWSQRYEVEIIHTALFIVKDTPDGIAHASKASVGFFLQVSWYFYGGPPSWIESNFIIHDVLCPMSLNNESVMTEDKTDQGTISIKEASLCLILSEIVSTKPLVR